MGYSQINDIDRVKSIMLLVGKDSIIDSFENNIGISWAQAKMSGFYVCGLKEKGVLYYLDGKYPYGSLVIEFDKCIIEKV